MPREGAACSMDNAEEKQAEGLYRAMKRTSIP
ncbi:hypothetical protein ED21_20584 [Erythrobacter sp. SD-21]|nr:hypothetical protein ED21_20584 [Erythrobacter sp. SD-21]